MIDHDYISTNEPCPDCGGPVLVDVAFYDESDGGPAHQIVEGYDCQELTCGTQFTACEWAIRTLASSAFQQPAASTYSLRRALSRMIREPTAGQ